MIPVYVNLYFDTVDGHDLMFEGSIPLPAVPRRGDLVSFAVPEGGSWNFGAKVEAVEVVIRPRGHDASFAINVAAGAITMSRDAAVRALETYGFSLLDDWPPTGRSMT